MVFSVRQIDLMCGVSFITIVTQLRRWPALSQPHTGPLSGDRNAGEVFAQCENLWWIAVVKGSIKDSYFRHIHRAALGTGAGVTAAATLAQLCSLGANLGTRSRSLHCYQVWVGGYARSRPRDGCSMKQYQAPGILTTWSLHIEATHLAPGHHHLRQPIPTHNCSKFQVRRAPCWRLLETIMSR